MKQFLIKYRFQNGSQESWHKDIAQFIAALDSDPDLMFGTANPFSVCYKI